MERLARLPATPRAIRIAQIFRDDTYGQMRHAQNLQAIHGVQSIFVAPAAARELLGDAPFVPATISRRPTPATMREAWRVAEALRRHRPHAVHSHSLATLPMSIVVASRLKIPLVHSPHALPVAGLSGSTIEVKAARTLIRFAALRGAAFVAVADGEAAPLRQAAGGAFTDVVVNPVPARFLQPSSVPRDDAAVLSLSRFWKQKDPILTVETWRRVHEAAPHARLLWAGEGPLEPDCRVLANHYGLSGSIDFLGRVPDPLPLLQRASLLVTSSAFEAMPYAVMEAMAAGAAVVATDIPAHREIEAGSGAITVSRADPNDMAANVVSLLHDEVGRARQRARARALVQERHSIEAFGERMRACYARILGEPVAMPEPIIEPERKAS